jgi:hypothetical protein
MKLMKTHHWPRRSFALALALLLSVCNAQAQHNAGTDWRYTVRPQDTVSELTRQHLKPNVTWAALARYNRLPDPNHIQAGTQLRIPLHWLAAQQAHARLLTLSGDVQTGLPDGTWRAARVGDLITIGQHVAVGRNSSASLQFADQSQLVIQPETTVVMDTLSLYAGGLMADTRVRLQAGRIEIKANPQGRTGQRFDIITPAAVASVRGTQFVVEAQQSRTTQQTTEGQVALQTDQGSVLVQQGFGSAVTAGERPLPPQLTKPAPVLQNPVSRFIDFPIAFNWAEEAGTTGWVMQVGRDPQMAEITLTQQSLTPQLDTAALPDGQYQLRAWYIDAQGLPSKPALHPFEVAIPRVQQGPALPLSPRYFDAGPLTLRLDPLPAGQRYLVQLTRDAAGRQPVWYKANANPSVLLPVPAEPEHTHHLWVWTY